MSSPTLASQQEVAAGKCQHFFDVERWHPIGQDAPPALRAAPVRESFASFLGGVGAPAVGLPRRRISERIASKAGSRFAAASADDSSATMFGAIQGRRSEDSTAPESGATRNRTEGATGEPERSRLAHAIGTGARRLADEYRVRLPFEVARRAKRCQTITYRICCRRFSGKPS